MNEYSPDVKSTFAKIGVIFSVFSIVSIVVQYLTVNLIAWIAPEFMTIDTEVVISSVCLYIIGLIVLCVGFRKNRLKISKPAKHSMKFLDFCKAFCMCYALLIISNIIGLLITSVIGMIKGSPVINPIEAMAMEISLPVMFIVTVIAAPVFEELFFRKFFIDRTLHFGEVPSILLSGFMFGMFHGNLSQFPYAFTIGVFFAYLYIRTGRLIYPVLLHAIINFLGSVASVTLLKEMDSLNSIQFALIGTEEEILNSVLSMVADQGFLMLVLYEAAVLIVVVIGLVLWILEWKKIRFVMQNEEMSKGNRLVAVMGNYGMITFCIIWIIMIIFSIIKIN